MAVVTSSNTQADYRDFPRSPTSISPISSRRTSLLPVESISPDTGLPPNAPRLSSRMTRKRAASLNTEVANHPRIEDLGIHSAGVHSPRPGSSPPREQVCLCQPDPKIPRPRNAFILYRQHYQASVVANHPGLANPEISKIIGEQWKNQPQDVKDEWKRLAEEEKQRHQRQYPDYRYQPRRAGKNNAGRLVSSASGEDPGRCPKCHGRYISTPSTPLTAYSSSSFGAQTPRLLPPFGAPHTPPRDEIPRYSGIDESQRYTNPDMSHPRNGQPPYNQMHRRSQYSGGPISAPLPPRDDVMAMESSDFKRRRYMDGSAAYPSPSPYGPQPSPRIGRPPQYPVEQRVQLPDLGHITHHPGSMEPPPRPSPISQHFPQRGNTFDESLRLPPLILSDTQHKEREAQSVEAMVMTIPYLNKIKVLAKIAPSLAIPGPSSPVHQAHGPVIAVEGSDPTAIAEVGKYIEEYLSREQECAVQTWVDLQSDMNTSKGKGLATDMDVDVPTGPPSPELTTNDKFISYLQDIRSWHVKSAEISAFVTTPPPAVISTPPSVSAQPPSPSSVSGGPPSATVKARIPVALMPRGFSLTVSDHYASLLPINDSYAPVDHWQWAATLWRGIIGPDLTIYVKPIDDDKDERDAMLKSGGVEIKGDIGAVIVRTDKPHSNDLLLEEKTLRRLGFEVLEFVRSFSVAGEDGRGPFARAT